MTDPFDRLARRASNEPFFVGFHLAAYQRRRGISDEQLASHLACPVEALAKLRLCRMPLIDDPQFDHHTRQITEYAGCDESTLRAVFLLTNQQDQSK